MFLEPTVIDPDSTIGSSISSVFAAGLTQIDHPPIIVPLSIYLISIYSESFYKAVFSQMRPVELQGIIEGH